MQFDFSNTFGGQSLSDQARNLKNSNGEQFYRKRKIGSARKIAQQSSLQTAGEYAGITGDNSIALKANRDRFSGHGDSLTQTRQKIEGTPEQAMAAWDTVNKKYGAPTNGYMLGAADDHEREDFRRELYKHLDENGKVEPGFASWLHSQFRNGITPTGSDVREARTNPDIGAQDVAELVKSPASVADALARSAAMSVTEPGSSGEKIADAFGKAVGGFNPAWPISVASGIAEGGAENGVQGAVDQAIGAIPYVGQAKVLFDPKSTPEDKLGAAIGALMMAAPHAVRMLGKSFSNDAVSHVVDEAGKSMDANTLQTVRETLSQSNPQEILQAIQLHEPNTKPFNREAFTKNLHSQETPLDTSQGAIQKPVEQPVIQNDPKLMSDADLVAAIKPIPPNERPGSPLWAEYEARRNGIRAKNQEPIPVQTPDSFTESMSAMNAKKATDALDKNVMNGGRAISRRTLVKEFVDQGATVQTINGERRLVKPDGGYLSESQISKTGMDYADHLNKPIEQPSTPTPETGVKEPLGKVKLAAGGEFDLISRNPDGTVTLRNDQGDTFDTNPGEKFTELQVAPKQAPDTTWQNQTRDQYVRAELDKLKQGRASRVEDAKSKARSLVPDNVRKSLPVGVDPVSWLESQPRNRLNKAQREAIAELNNWRNSLNGDYRNDTNHFGRVYDALNANKPVPPEVLADYPDLQPSTPTPETGKPITANVYHATDKTFSNFDLAKSGSGLGETDHPSAWFHENPKWANMISERFRSKQGRVMPSTVEFKNPLVIDAEDYARRVSHTTDQAFVVDGQKLYDIKWFKNIALRDAIDGGHDGLIIRNGYDLIPIKGDVYAATDASTIRPAITPETGVKEPVAPDVFDSQHPVAIYNGKKVTIDYASDPKRSFQVAAQRVQDNLPRGGKGYVTTPKGEIYEITEGKRSAKRVDQIPPEVLADYPDLQKGTTNETELQTPQRTARKIGSARAQEPLGNSREASNGDQEPNTQARVKVQSPEQTVGSKEGSQEPRRTSSMDQPQENGEPSGDQQKTIGSKVESVNLGREDSGLDMKDPLGRKGLIDLAKESGRKLYETPEGRAKAEQNVIDWASGKEVPLTEENQALSLAHMNELKRQYDRARSEAIVDPSNGYKQVAKQKAMQALDDATVYHRYGIRASSAYQFMLGKMGEPTDFANPAEMKAEAASKRKLTADEEAEFESRANKIADLQSKLDDANKKIQDLIKKGTNRTSPRSSTKFKSADDFRASIAERRANGTLYQTTGDKQGGAIGSKGGVGYRKTSAPNLTPDDIAFIWDYAKKNFIDVDYRRTFDQMISDTAKELDLTPEEVTHAFAADKSIKALTEDYYRNSSKRRQAVNEAKARIQGLNTPKGVKVLQKIWNIPRSLQTMGHAVGMVSHAGANAYRPWSWPQYWKAFGNQYKFLASRQAHEAAVLNIENNPRYGEAVRAGFPANSILASDEGAYINQSKTRMFGKLSNLGNEVTEGGTRAMDVLRTYVFDVWDKQISEAPIDIKNDPQFQKEAMQWALSSAGSPKPLMKGMVAGSMYSPRLETSRWQRMIIDPAKTLLNAAKWKTLTPAEKHMTVFRAKQAGATAGVYIGTLAANAALLKATNAKDDKGRPIEVNFTDPSKSDFLKHKSLDGHTIDTIGNAQSPIVFMSQLIKDSLGSKDAQYGPQKNKTPFERVTGTVGFYVRGKLNPAIGQSVDIATKSDMVGRPLWNASQEAKDKYKKSHPESEAYGPLEYFGTHDIPIAGSEIVRDFYSNIRKHTDRSTAENLMRSLALLPVTGAGYKISETGKKYDETGGKPFLESFGPDTPTVKALPKRKTGSARHATSRSKH